jgi:hypothetical protein
MIPESLLPIANHLWQSTLFAGTAGLLTLALRRNPARVRHWVWVAASLKFLVPFSLLVAYVFPYPSARDGLLAVEQGADCAGFGERGILLEGGLEQGAGLLALAHFQISHGEMTFPFGR